MSCTVPAFEPCTPLIPGVASSACRAIVTIPARNEEQRLPQCLDALASQVDREDSPLDPDSFEVLVLLNNCCDSSARVLELWAEQHPAFHVHGAVRQLAPEEAHVGTARRLLMDTAWARLRQHQHRTAILSTDADTLVAPDWIAQNLHVLQSGADVVGGLICLQPQDLFDLPSFVQRCYEQDRRYACLVARLEHLLDPCEGDACPRHLDHFGSSLACTPEAYERAGGMPAISKLEDEAFVDRVRRANLCLRHDPVVRVYTSARLQGRATMGLAGQLRLWNELTSEREHTVPSSALLEHRFHMMRQLRQIFQSKEVGSLHLPTDWWRTTFAEALRDEVTCPGFLGAVYCDIFIAEAFSGPKEEPIAEAITGLERRLATPRPAPARRVRAAREATAASIS